ncbi:hypothetical protein I3843_07G123700 [Carya illinoinensis]|nr:hypothetical protein I3843_07G123700 [Carya illinoinensis]
MHVQGPLDAMSQMEIAVNPQVSITASQTLTNKATCDLRHWEHLHHEQKSVGRKNPPARPLGMIIKVKPQAKQARLDPGASEESSVVVKIPDGDTEKSSEPVTTSNSS